MTAKHLAAAAAVLLASAASAAPADDARQHFQAIGKGDVAAIAGAYAPKAQLEWVGGPLDGTYRGAKAIEGVWQKFTKAQGPLEVTAETVEEAANPKGATVTANVVYKGKQPLKVRQVVTYRDGHIVAETWQVAPKLEVGAP